MTKRKYCGLKKDHWFCVGALTTTGLLSYATAKQVKHLCKPVSTEEETIVTLRYLAIGETAENLIL